MSWLTSLNVPINGTDIEHAHRIYRLDGSVGHPREIIVAFTTRKRKDFIYRGFGSAGRGFDSAKAGDLAQLVKAPALVRPINQKVASSKAGVAAGCQPAITVHLTVRKQLGCN